MDVSAVWIQKGETKKRPSDLDLGKFMERELQVDEDDVDFIDFHSLRRFFSVRFIEEMEEKCNLVAARLVEGVFWEEAGVVVHGWRSDGRERVIRI